MLLLGKFKIGLLYIDVLLFHQQIVEEFGNGPLHFGLCLLVGHLLDLIGDLVRVHLTFNCRVERKRC